MVGYATLLVLLSMVATARCSWLSGGAPSPASIGDFETLGDELLDNLAPARKLLVEEKDQVAPGPVDDFFIQEKHEEEEDDDDDDEEEKEKEKEKAAPGPSSEKGEENKAAPGPSSKNGEENKAAPGPGSEKGEENKVAPGPGSGNDEFAPGPSDVITIKEKSSIADDDPAAAADGPAGPSDGITIEEKSSIADGPAGAADGARLIRFQVKESKVADGQNFIVQGKVYCDPCRIQFPTKISYPLANTKVVLLCHKEETDEETYRLEGTSDDKGTYKINAAGDHADEVCEIIVSESPDPKCPELMDDENHVRVSLTNKQGAKGNARLANPLGFMVTDADPRCKEVLDELGFTGI